MMIKEIKFTDNAIKHINNILSKKDEGIFFRIAIKGGGCSGFQYDFSFDIFKIFLIRKLRSCKLEKNSILSELPSLISTFE